MKNRFYKALFSEPWHYWVGAIVLAFLNILVFMVRKKPWGITRNIEDWSRLVFSHLGIGYPSQSFNELLFSTNTMLNVGIILGALLATLVTSQARLRMVRNRKYVYLALFGGFIMGYGARIAYGCNIGGFMNGIASGSLSGWIFGVAVFIGAWIGSKILVRFFI